MTENFNNILFSTDILFLSAIIFIASLSIIPSTLAQETLKNDNSCRCVIFRMDDIQDYWIQVGQLTPMDLFMSKNQSLSLGLIMNHIGNDSKVIGKLQEGVQKGLFELDIHGWDHIDYTQLSEAEQKDSLYKANEKMQMLFGNTSDIFIPPLDQFNNSTLKAMNDLGLRILSSQASKEYEFNENRSVFISDRKTGDSKKNQTIYHLPAMVFYKVYNETSNTKNPTEKILSDVMKDIAKYGYSVILFHPQDFMKIENGSFTNVVDYKEVEDLSRLIDSILSKNISLTSFSKIVNNNADPVSESYELRIINRDKETPDTCLSFDAASTSSQDYTTLGASDRIDPKELNGLDCSMAQIYNMYGKYLYEKASSLGIPSSDAAATLYVESSGSGFGPDGRMIIRFESCIFYEQWGVKHPEEFSKYFQCGRQNDKFRISPSDEFTQYHGNYNKEWKIFEFARNLDEKAALNSISMGLGQIMGFNADKVGYRSAKEMFDNMSNNLKSQIDGFFLALSYKDNRGVSCMDSLKANNYEGFAACYNGYGQNAAYGSRIKEAAEAYKEVTTGRLYSDSLSNAPNINNASRTMAPEDSATTAVPNNKTGNPIIDFFTGMLGT
jgi:peptidoglycan/xylan/chitin deacetylase (PgdA/CDA1 family)